MSIAERWLKASASPGKHLATLLVLGMLGACATPVNAPEATRVVAATVDHAPTAGPAASQTPPESPTPPATAPAPTEVVTPSETPETPTRPAPTVAPTITPPAEAQYMLTFEAAWSRETHPDDFPPNPHFSGLIGATHSPAAHVWQEGGAATAGIQSMAETGRKSPLDSEIDSLIGSGSACTQISAGGVNVSPGTATVAFTASLDCPLVSVVTMIAPSPDWFVGVADLDLLGPGEWIDQHVVELLPYDAGTDSGISYTSPDETTDSPEMIHRIETGPFVIDGQVPPLCCSRPRP